ncbi:MAG: glucose-1-phosphate adenylyltransferase [Verrucomicrobia bacterium]|nr:glucose-1-phosphate adenylyltransferase [Verrucomicrobiota bacterium]MBS0647101.1 glucose-1-phosphate adenylyltransferase [Verrucomicrobiota bacterium]
MVSPQNPPRLNLDRIAVIILGGGEGKRLDPLTKTRCKPAVSFGGRYTLIDVPISHSLASGLSKIYVIGQYLAYTLQKHLFQTYLHYGISQNQIQLIVPEERDSQQIWYQGTADAVRKNLHYFSEIQADYFLILSGDQLYNINFQDMIEYGIRKDAGMLIAAQPVTEKNATRMGLMHLDKSGRVTDFYEKPQDEALLQQFYIDQISLAEMGCNAKPGHSYLGSMGIYFFKRQTLFNLLNEDKREDFGKHLIASQMKKKDVYAYIYDGYWEDIGTVESYYHANLALTRRFKNSKEGLQCYDGTSMIITKTQHLPGTQVSNCKLEDVLLCEGSIVRAREVTNSVVGIRSVIEQGATIRDSILMGNEFYERPPLELGQRPLNPKIGENSLICKAIIDENVSIGNGVKLINQHHYKEYNASDGRLFVRDGIIIVPRGAVIPDHYIF